MGKLKSFATAALMAGALLTWSRNARAATYYVATDGSDSNAGTLASPFLTIQKGVNAANAGDTIIVENGTYTGCQGDATVGEVVEINKAGTSSAWITLEAQNQGGAVIDAQMTCASSIDLGASSAYWKIIGFDVRDGYWSGIYSGTAGGGDNLLIKGNIIHNVGNRYNNNNTAITGIYIGQGQTNVTIDSNLLHDNGPTSAGSGDPAHDHQMYLHGSNVNVTNNVLYNGYNGPYINLGASNGTFSGTIANNTFYGYSISSYYIDGAIYFNGSPGNNGIVPIIENNIFYNVRTLALNGAQLASPGCVVANNIVFDAAGVAGAGSAQLINTAPSGCTPTGNILNVDPKLQNPTVTSYANTNFQLLAGSPAIGAGIQLAAVTTDFDGNSRDSRNDLGAFEYAGSVAPPAVAPVISAVSATGITASSATVTWTTNEPADSQVVYGLTTAYGSATTLNSTLATSHSVAVTGLTASTVYHYAVKSHDSSGDLTTSPDATFTTPAAVAAIPAGCLSGAASAWSNSSIAAQAGFFTVQFDATPGLADMDGVAGLSNGAATAFTSQAAAVRFNNTGTIDARNAGAYAAATSVPYVAGMTYHFSLAVNLVAHTYSATVTQGSNAAQTIATNYAFRTEQAAAATLNDFGVYADAGSVLACNVAVTASAPPTAVSAVSATGITQTGATIEWTTNNPAESQVKYGLTTAYGSETTLNSTPTTSHSVSLGGLTAGTVYHYQVLSVDAAGNLTTSSDETFTTEAAAPAAPVIPPGCVVSEGSVWKNVPMSAETGSFTAAFSATPSQADMDGIVGLSDGASAALTSQAAAVRFNDTGTIDARNGGAYAAASSIPYAAGTAYSFELVVNLKAHTYSAYVTGPSGQKTIGLNYAFRTEQKAATLLNNLAAFADAGSVMVCNVVP